MTSTDDADDSLNRLIRTHPSLFVGQAPMDSFLPHGWYEIVDQLCADIAAALGQEMSGRVHVLQIKQKLGGLRFSARVDPVDATLEQGAVGITSDQTSLIGTVDRPLDEQARLRISELIAAAESTSLGTCEVCSAPGSRRNLSWRQTLCNRHFEVAKAVQAELDAEE